MSMALVLTAMALSYKAPAVASGPALAAAAMRTSCPVMNVMDRYPKFRQRGRTRNGGEYYASGWDERDEYYGSGRLGDEPYEGAARGAPNAAFDRRALDEREQAAAAFDAGYSQGADRGDRAADPPHVDGLSSLVEYLSLETQEAALQWCIDTDTPSVQVLVLTQQDEEFIASIGAQPGGNIDTILRDRLAAVRRSLGAKGYDRPRSTVEGAARRPPPEGPMRRPPPGTGRAPPAGHRVPGGAYPRGAYPNGMYPPDGAYPPDEYMVADNYPVGGAYPDGVPYPPAGGYPAGAGYPGGAYSDDGTSGTGDGLNHQEYHW
jgi:hypothetical protein